MRVSQEREEVAISSVTGGVRCGVSLLPEAGVQQPVRQERRPECY